jgi:formylglycine-generating enzyme required for sulfatase activity
MNHSARWTVFLLFFALLAAAASVLPVSIGAADDKAQETLRAFLKEFVLSEFVEITPGKGKYPASFTMGSASGPASEQPAHEVTIAGSFHMAKGEVPQHLYAVVMGKNPSKWKGPRNSAEMFSYADAVEFCRKLTVLLRESKLLADNEEIRLPTEAEWEYCCRAGTKTAYSFGDSAVNPGDTENKASRLDEFGWHHGNAAGNDPPVGAKKPNPWGLYDMHGYLWEFVADAWHDNYEGAPADGRAWGGDDAKARRVIRGGSWKDRFEQHQSSTRRAVGAEAADDAIGFRCVKAKVARQ